jgi:F1F0 ATPase subunit 2
MDGQRVTVHLGISLACHLLGGMILGALYFSSLWWNTRLFERAGQISLLVGSMAARFLLLGGVLTAASLEGAMPLLATALGLLLARTAVLRRTRTASSA